MNNIYRELIIIKMILIRPLVNAFAVYNSYMVRPVVYNKPKTCNSLITCVRKPWLFDDRDMCPDCTCSFSCRYINGGTPELVPHLIPDENIRKNLAYHINEDGSKTQSVDLSDTGSDRIYY